jgi:hypothetical protein
LSSSPDYRSISDRDLVEYLERGDMQSDAALYTEFLRRMREQGKHYRNTPEDWERFKLNIHRHSNMTE